MTTAIGPVNEWRQLVAAAVLGSERAGTRLPAIGGSLAALSAQPESDAAEALLRNASVLSVYMRAGRRPAPGFGESVRLCDDRGAPPCSFRAGQHLARILYGEFGLLLEEWCDLAAARGVRAPDEMLSGLLDRLVAKPDAAAATVAQVLGARGEWLASMNPRWRDVARPSDSPGDVWQTGTKVQRLAWLRRLRQLDPQASRDHISKSWSQEDGDDRAAFVATFVIGLSIDDEPVLEMALDDGRKPVRQAAADLLARLPGSAFCTRMGERATSLITIEQKKRLLRGATLQIEVALPEKPDKVLLRDSVENKRCGGMGERAHVLCQIVAATPLKIWEACGAEPAEIIRAAIGTDWREPLVRGWSIAAARQRSAAWADLLLRIGLKTGDESDFEVSQQLVTSLGAEDRERVLMLIFHEPTIPLSRSLQLLEYCTHAWSEQFSHAALAALRSHFGTPEAYSAHALRNAVKQSIVRYLSPSLATEAETGWNRTDAHWHRGDEEMVSTLATTLAFRRHMQEELSL